MGDATARSEVVQRSQRLDVICGSSEALRHSTEKGEAAFARLCVLQEVFERCWINGVDETLGEKQEGAAECRRVLAQRPNHGLEFGCDFLAELSPNRATEDRYHSDPFDRVMIAQARAENLTLVSVDERFPQYDVELLPLS